LIIRIDIYLLTAKNLTEAERGLPVGNSVQERSKKMAEQDETRIYTEQEINQVVEQIDNMCLSVRDEGELLFRCKWITRQLQKGKKK